MERVRIKINGVDIAARPDATILEASRENRNAARENDIYVPTLYYLKDVNEGDLSGICVVEVEGEDNLVNASLTKVEDGMVISSNSPAVIAARTEVLKNILAIHNQDCKNCFRTGNCELQSLTGLYRVRKDQETAKAELDPIDESTIVVRDHNKCVRCGRCVSVCHNIQSVEAINLEGSGLEGKVVPAEGNSLGDTKCVNCGQCVTACPVGALHVRDDGDKVMEALEDPSKFVVIQTAPSVRVGLAEAFDFPIGVDVEGKLAAALRAIGFDRVFDTVFGADLTIVEEAHELITRIQEGGTLPMFTSCCPAWIKLCEQDYPEIIPNISTCKSPQQMFGAVTKTYYAEKEEIPVENIVVVSAMPCSAKKFEITRADQDAAGVPDVDYSITNRELARMIKQAGIKFAGLPEEGFDSILGSGTGAGVIFGATGGVMEAALRTAMDIMTGQTAEAIEYQAVRGIEGVKEATVAIGDKELKVAAVSGLANARALLEKMKDASVSFDFVEIMACPGGCVNGGGQPIQEAPVRAVEDLREKRAAALYKGDEARTLRKSHENPMIRKVYDTYIGTPGNDKAHGMLHTSYASR